VFYFSAQNGHLVRVLRRLKPRSLDLRQPVDLVFWHRRFYLRSGILPQIGLLLILIAAANGVPSDGDVGAGFAGLVGFDDVTAPVPFVAGSYVDKLVRLHGIRVLFLLSRIISLKIPLCDFSHNLLRVSYLIHRLVNLSRSRANRQIYCVVLI